MKTNIPEHIELAVRSVIGCDRCWSAAWTQSKTRNAVMVRDLTAWAVSTECMTFAEVGARIGIPERRAHAAVRRFEQDCEHDKTLARWREGVKGLLNVKTNG